jgi:bifunctional polynucleotide phosphatase/kinase
MNLKYLDGLYYYLYDNILVDNDCKHAIFDLDNTLIITRSGNVFPKDKNDWKPYNNKVKDTLHKFIDNKFTISIITNQKGISNKKISIDDFSTKIDNILSYFEIHANVFISIENNKYRKPLTGIYNRFLDKINTSISFYCGDAGLRLSDHSPSDIYFANNINIPFIYPDDLFNTETLAQINELNNLNLINSITHINNKYNKIKIHLSEYINDLSIINSTFPYISNNNNDNNNNNSSDKELILLIGPPASGKTFLATSNKYKDYVHINNDKLKTKTVCLSTFNEALKLNKNIIIDNTNPTYDKYETYLSKCKENNYKIYTYIFNIPRKTIYHMNNYRCITGIKAIKTIPAVVYNTYYKNLNFDEIKQDKDIFIKIINNIYIDDINIYNDVIRYLFDFKGYKTKSN